MDKLDLTKPSATDWQGTAFQQMSSLETALYCPCCAKLFNTPTMLECGHLFCSVCIRSWCASSDVCPSARSPPTSPSSAPAST